MEILGIELSSAGWSELLTAIREFALPRLGVSALVLFFAAAVHRGAGWILGRVEQALVRRTETGMDDAVTRAVRRTLILSVWFWASWRVALVWELQTLAQVAIALWIGALAFPLAALISDLLEIAEGRVARESDTPLDETALPLLNKFIRFLVVILGALVALETVGVDVTPLLAGAGVAGLAVSLAAKDTLSNLIAGILLILDRPFRVGDRIELWTTPGETGSWGDVLEIGLRATKIRNPDNLIVVIPNNEIMRRDIVNYTASGNHIRLRIPFGISYDSDMKEAKRLVEASAREVSGVKAEPPPKVIVRRFGDSSVDLELRVWIDDARRRRAVGDAITEGVKEAFDAHGIEIPYPKRDLYLRRSDDGNDGVPTERRAEADSGKEEPETKIHKSIS